VPFHVQEENRTIYPAIFTRKNVRIALYPDGSIRGRVTTGVDGIAALE